MAISYPISPWVRVETRTLDPAQPADVDWFSFTEARAVRWICTVFSLAEDKTKLFEISVSRSHGDLNMVVFGQTGDPIRVAIDLVESAGLVYLRLTNRESYQIKADLIRALFAMP